MVRGFKGDGLGPQAGVGIAQATLYVIVVPAVYFGFVKPRGARQHIPCLALFIFSAREYFPVSRTRRERQDR